MQGTGYLSLLRTLAAAAPHLPPEVEARGRSLPLYHGTLDVVRVLLALPRDVRLHPETGHAILAALERSGPWVRHGDTDTSIGENDDMLTVDFNEAVSLLPQRGYPPLVHSARCDKQPTLHCAVPEHIIALVCAERKTLLCR